MPTIHIVSHTHWDREWYHAAGRFRQRLVALVDELLEWPCEPPASFLLDGQTVVLEDYLSVRPERATALAGELRAGVLEAGPWFVLADELIPSGEALVRNLLAGRRILRALGAEPPAVLYCPDSFGHPAALPALAAGFGFGVVVVWRGFGGRRWPAGDACWWRAPSGERVLLYHLPPSGYELGATLPLDANAAAARWREIRDQLVPRSRLAVALLLNGADHHARQRNLGTAVAALREAAAPAEVRAGSLGTFAAEALGDAALESLPEVAGELRDSYGYTWTLQGTFGTRAAQKRRNAAIERLLVHEAEPWTALAARRTGQSRRPLAQAAWRALLLGHPHDTLCGCSIDEVARAFDARLDDAVSQARGLRDDAVLAVLGHDVERARDARDAWRPHLVVRNPAARPRGGVAIVELSRFLSDEPVGPGSARHTRAAPRASTRPVKLAGLGRVQVLGRRREHERTESPRAYPDNDLVERLEAAVWVPELPGYGMRGWAQQVGRAAGTEIPHPVVVEPRTLRNGRLRVDVAGDGTVTLRDEQTGRTLGDLVVLEDRDDRGDLYTPSVRGPARTARCLGARIVHRGPLRGALEMRCRLLVRRRQRIELRLRLTLDADASMLRLHVDGVNGADDHRLRLGIRTGIADPRVHADAAFGFVERQRLSVPPEDAVMESPAPTAPLHRTVTLSDGQLGVTVVSDGLAEYEATPDGMVFITLVRSVGELSRNDLPGRPGHAGWPTPTPGAQCHGPFAAELAVLMHEAWSDGTAEAVTRAAEDLLTPLAGRTIRSWVTAAPEVAGLALQGRGLAFSAAKESEDGRWLALRCVNLGDRSVAGRWVVAGGVREARLARLDETPGDALAVAGDAVEFEAPPRGIVTVLVG